MPQAPSGGMSKSLRFESERRPNYLMRETPLGLSSSPRSFMFSIIPAMGEQERTKLVQRAVSGDTDAMQHLMVSYHAALHAAVASAIPATLRRHVDADDVLQAAYMAAFRARTRLQADGPAQFYRWLEAIALNELKMVERGLRARKRDVARVAHDGDRHTGSYQCLAERIAGPQSTPSRHAARNEAAARLVSSLARLPDDQREAVRLRFLEDVPVAQIAQRLGKTEGAVYALCHRGLANLRQFMHSVSQ
jgi:RNA polymerase sigma-70 factor, ECF subfamily